MAGAGGIRAGRAFVELFTKNNRLVRGLKRARASLKAFSGFAKTQGMKLSAFGLGAGATIAGPLLAAGKAFASVGDKVHKMAARTGVSATALTELGHAAALSGASMDQLGAGLFRMRRRVANATTGTGPAVRALKELGIAAGDIGKKTTEEQFMQLVGALAGMSDKSRAAQLAFELFGDGAKALLPMIEAGTVGIEEMRAEARRLGVVMTDEAAADAAQLTDAMFSLWASIKGGVIAIGAQVAPFLTRMAEGIATVFGTVSNWIQANSGLVKSVLRVVGVVLVVLGGVTALGSALALLGFTVAGMLAGLSAIGAALAFVFNPLTLLVAGLVAAGAAFVHFSGTGAAALGFLREKFATLLATVQPVLAGIQNAFAAGNLGLAAQIAWLGVQAAFMAGSLKVREIWYGFTNGLFTAFETAIDKIRTFWNDVVSNIAKGLLTVAGWLGLVDSEASIAIITQDQTAFADDLSRQTERRTAQRSAEGDAALNEARGRLAALRDELSAATEQAATEAAAAAPDAPTPTAPTAAVATTSGPGAGTAAGTFSAMGAALLGGGGGGFQQQQLDRLDVIALNTGAGAEAGQALNSNLGTA